MVSRVPKTGSCEIQQVSNSFPSYNDAALTSPWRILKCFSKGSKGDISFPYFTRWKTKSAEVEPREGWFSVQNQLNYSDFALFCCLPFTSDHHSIVTAWCGPPSTPLSQVSSMEWELREVPIH